MPQLHSDSHTAISLEKFLLEEFKCSKFLVENPDGSQYCLIALINITLAIMYRRGGIFTLTWALFAAVLIIVYSLNWYWLMEQQFHLSIGSGLSISAIVPVLYLLVVWIMPLVIDLIWPETQDGKELGEAMTKASPLCLNLLPSSERISYFLKLGYLICIKPYFLIDRQASFLGCWMIASLLQNKNQLILL
jgi:hypothetical protein